MKTRASLICLCLVSLSSLVSLVGCAAEEAEESESSTGAQTSAAADGGADADARADATAEGGASSRRLLSLDGKPCTVTSASVDVVFGGHGWTLAIGATCPMGLTLQVSGVMDAPYPQTDINPFLEEEGAILFLDKDTFRTSNTGGRVSIAVGPRRNAPASIRGTVRVADDLGATHELGFDVLPGIVR